MSDAPKLNCLGGQETPEEFVTGWKNFLAFPREAQNDFWEVVYQGLTVPSPEVIQQAGRQFCEKYTVDEADGALALQVCVQLISQGTALDLSQEQFRDDLMRLGNDDPVAAEFVASRYQQAKQVLRGALLGTVLADHGKVMTGLNWRVETVQAADRAANLNATVIHLSFQYQEGMEVGRVNLQLTPESLQAIKAFTNRF
jgi:hypothetical protein